MTKRLKAYLLIVFAAACLACTLVGCKIGRPGRAELLAGYDSHVTYYSNGGYFNGSNTISVIEIYYKAGDSGVPFFFVSDTTGKAGMKIERRGYRITGWYEPAKYTAEDGEQFADYIGELKYEITYTRDSNGNISDKFVPGSNNNATEAVFPVIVDGKQVIDADNDRPVYARMDGNGNLRDEKITENLVTVVCDKSKPVAVYDDDNKEVNNCTIARDDEIEVCADWELTASIRYNLIVTDENGKVVSGNTYYNVVETDNDGNEKVTASYKNEDPIIVRPMRGESSIPLDLQLVKIEGLSFVKTFMNKELTQPVHSVTRPEGENPIVDVYCRYIVGDWTVVSTASKVAEMFNGLGTGGKYLVLPNAAKEIDCSGVQFNLRTGSYAAPISNATIVVDGKDKMTLSNLSFRIYRDNVSNGSTYSILGDIKSSFKVSGGGLILKDISIGLPSTSGYTAYGFNAICSSAEAAASANVDLTVDTVRVTYEGEPNAINYGNLTGTNWLLGNVNLTQFTGLKLVDGDNGEKYSITKE